MSVELLAPVAAFAAASSNEIRFAIKSHLQPSGLDMDLSEAWQEGKADLVETSSKRQKVAKFAALAVFAAAVGFEWGPGNETFLSFVAGQNLKEAEGVLSPLIIGAKTGVASFIEQSLCGLSGMAAIHSVPRFMSKIRETKELHTTTNVADDIVEKQSRLTKMRKRTSLSFVTGANFFLLKQHASSADLTKADEVKSIATSAAAVGTCVTGIGAIVGLAHYGGPEVAETVGTYITPVVLGVIATGGAISIASKRRSRDTLMDMNQDDTGQELIETPTLD